MTTDARLWCTRWSEWVTASKLQHADCEPDDHYDPQSLRTENARLKTQLGFDELRVANLERCESPAPYGFGHRLVDWSPLEWAGAMCGEAGEAANAAKKLRRGDAIEISRIGHEVADAVIYADLLCARLGLDLGALVRDTFNAKSRERGMAVFLSVDGVRDDD